MLKVNSSVHPFFLNGTVPESKLAGSKKLTTQVSFDTAANIEGSSRSTSGPSKTKAKKSTRDVTAPSSKSTPDASTLPFYSYKDYSPKATAVYTQHEDEANDLVSV